MAASRALLCSLAGVAAACGSETPPRGPIVAEVTHYDYTVDLATRAAHATVTATITTAGDCWTLPLRADSPQNLALNGAPVASATIDAVSLTACGRGYDEGEQLVLDADVTIAAATEPPTQVGFSAKPDATGNAFVYLLSWVGECDRFGPCDNAANKFATYRFDVTHDPSLTVRCPGDITDVSTSETVCDFGYGGGPTYSTFSIVGYAGWTTSDLGSWGGVHVTLYDHATTGIAAKLVPSYHDGYVGWLVGQLGPYPFGSELRVLTAPTYWGGFEHPGNITLQDGLAHVRSSPYSDELAHTLDHEITHMWAGDQTTLADTYDFAWKESMAEYLPSVWEDMADPAVALRTAGAWKTFAYSAAYYPVPTDRPALVDFYGDVYGAGPMILFRQVESMSSRAQVLAAIHDVLGTPHALSIADLEAALSQHTGIELAGYFDAWLHGSGTPAWPKFDVTYTPGSLVLHQINPGPKQLGCRFHVALDGANAGERVLVPVDTIANGSEQTLAVATPAFTVIKAVLDPLNECLVFPATVQPRTVRQIFF